jgi:hypothetical protein
MTPYNHLTTGELLNLVRYPLGGVLTDLETELANRLEDAHDLNQETEHNLALLAAKYKIPDSDLIECELDTTA